MSELHVIIPGFGNPHIENKIQILESNMKYLEQFKWNKVIYSIFVYDEEIITKIPEYLLNKYNINWFFSKGVVWEFIYNNEVPSKLIEFSHIIILLDDVELLPNFNIKKAIRYINEYNIDILSPCLSDDSKFEFKWMQKQSNNALRVVSACEFFCYIMTYNGYVKYFEHIDINNRWGWGMDLLLDYKFGLKVMITDNMSMRHHYKNESYNAITEKEAYDGREYIMTKYNTTLNEVANRQLLKYIIDVTI